MHHASDVFGSVLWTVSYGLTRVLMGLSKILSWPSLAYTRTVIDGFLCIIFNWPFLSSRLQRVKLVLNNWRDENSGEWSRKMIIKYCNLNKYLRCILSFLWRDFLPSIEKMLSSSVSLILSRASKLLTRNTCVLGGLDAILSNSAFAPYWSKALPTYPWKTKIRTLSATQKNVIIIALFFTVLIKIDVRNCIFWLACPASVGGDTITTLYSCWGTFKDPHSQNVYSFNC